jgi:hypothetical protein
MANTSKANIQSKMLKVILESKIRTKSLLQFFFLSSPLFLVGAPAQGYRSRTQKIYLVVKEHRCLCWSTRLHELDRVYFAKQSESHVTK